MVVFFSKTKSIQINSPAIESQETQKDCEIKGKQKQKTAGGHLNVMIQVRPWIHIVGR